MLLAVVFNFLFFSIVLAFVRLSDKCYWLEFKRLVYQFWGEMPELSQAQIAFLEGN